MRFFLTKDVGTQGSVTIGTVAQGAPGVSAWPVTDVKLDITTSALRDALLGTSNKTLTDVVNAIAGGSGVDPVGLKDTLATPINPATEDTLLGVATEVTLGSLLTELTGLGVGDSSSLQKVVAIGGTGSGLGPPVTAVEMGMNNADGMTVVSAAKRCMKMLSHIMLFNGTTYDRLRGDSTEGLWAKIKAALPAGANLIGDVGIKPRTSGGFSTFHLVSAGSTNATNVKAAAGQLFGWYIYNSNAAARKVAFHNTAGTPTAGASVFFSLTIPPNAAANAFTETGIAFSTGIAVTTVTGLADSDATAVAANDLTINLFYA